MGLISAGIHFKKGSVNSRTEQKYYLNWSMGSEKEVAEHQICTTTLKGLNRNSRRKME